MARPSLPAALTQGRAARGRRSAATAATRGHGARKVLGSNPSTRPCRAASVRADGGEPRTTDAAGLGEVSVGRAAKLSAKPFVWSLGGTTTSSVTPAQCRVYDVTRSAPPPSSSTLGKLFQELGDPRHVTLAADSTHSTLYRYLDLSISLTLPAGEGHTHGTLGPPGRASTSSGLTRGPKVITFHVFNGANF